MDVREKVWGERDGWRERERERERERGEKMKPEEHVPVYMYARRGRDAAAWRTTFSKCLQRYRYRM